MCDGIQISPEVLVNTPPNDTAHASLDDSAHASVDDTVEVATPSDNTNKPVVTPQPVGDATENGNTAEACRYPQRTHYAPDKYIEKY